MGKGELGKHRETMPYAGADSSSGIWPGRLRKEKSLGSQESSVLDYMALL